jgi:hypothetical protein
MENQNQLGPNPTNVLEEAQQLINQLQNIVNQLQQLPLQNLVHNLQAGAIPHHPVLNRNNPPVNPGGIFIDPKDEEEKKEDGSFRNDRSLGP